MKIVRNQITYQVFYQFNNKDECRLDEYGMWGKIRALDTKDSTHEIIYDTPKEDQWKIPAMMYDTFWEIYDQEIWDVLYEQELQRQIEKKCKDVFNLRLQKTYSNTEVDFPDGPATIQFRNDFDRSNVSDLALGALAVSQTNPNKPVKFRDADNKVHMIKAKELVDIALNVMDGKQEIVAASWVHKDALRSLTTLEDVKYYNIYEGWPV